MSYTLRKRFTFEAAHHLHGHNGKCQRVHGHSWVGYIEVQGKTLITRGPQVGMLIDYGVLSAVVDPLVEMYLDHYDLNLTTGLENPTSEELARWIFDRVVVELPSLSAVIIQETCTSECRYARH